MIHRILFFSKMLSATLHLQVLISYIDILYTTEDRNNRLRESYFFTCDCQECKSKSMVRVCSQNIIIIIIIIPVTEWLRVWFQLFIVFHFPGQSKIESAQAERPHRARGHQQHGALRKEECRTVPRLEEQQKYPLLSLTCYKKEEHLLV